MPTTYESLRPQYCMSCPKEQLIDGKCMKCKLAFKKKKRSAEMSLVPEKCPLCLTDKIKDGVCSVCGATFNKRPRKKKVVNHFGLHGVTDLLTKRKRDPQVISTDDRKNMPKDRRMGTGNGMSWLFKGKKK